MSLLHDGRVALVTGAASGIGRASALAFAREGASVVVTDIDASALAETTAMIVAAGGSVAEAVADIADEGTATALVSLTIDRFGRLDCAHNNAGISIVGSAFENVDEADFDRIVRVNVRSVFLCMQAELRAFVSAGSGAIVNTASSAGLIGVADHAPYSASKHAVIGLTRTAALEFAAVGIRVNAICPGPVDTPMLMASMAGIAPSRLNPMQRLGTPAEIAETVVWLCSDRASFVTGEALQVDGGLVEAEGQLRHD